MQWHNKSTRMTTGKIGLVVVAVVLIFLLLVSRIKLGPEPSIAPAQRLSSLDQVAPASDQLCETVVHINSSSVDIPPSSWTDLEELKKDSYTINNLNSWLAEGSITKRGQKKHYQAQRICYDLAARTYYVHSKMDQELLDYIMHHVRLKLFIKHLPEELRDQPATVLPGRTLSIDLPENVFHGFMQMSEGKRLLTGNKYNAPFHVDRVFVSGVLTNWKKGMFQLIFTDTVPRKHIVDPTKGMQAFGAQHICFEEAILVNEYSRDKAPFLVDGLRKRAYELFNLGHLHMRNSPMVTLIDRTRTRRFINKYKILEMLSDLGVGFQVIELRTNQEFLDQVAWMRSSTIVVAAHGAALTNIMFMPPGAALYEIFPPKFLYQKVYYNMAGNLSLVYKAEQVDYAHSSASFDITQEWRNYTTRQCTLYPPCRWVHRPLDIEPNTRNMARWIKDQLRAYDKKMNTNYTKWLSKEQKKWIKQPPLQIPIKENNYNKPK